tara:strand:- start:443 stop:1186 length:744 start_codon:yes stop_codon:yes gene_type:complete
MIAKRIIAVLTFDNGILTRTKNFIQDYRYTSNFINNSLFDAIVLIDISKTKKNRNNFYNVVQNFAKNCFVPICVGGSISSIDEVKKFQKLGVDKILINSLLIENSKKVKDIINIFGNQFVVIGIDIKKTNGKNWCFYNRGKKKIKMEFNKYLDFIKKINPGEILFQSIDLDGSLKGYELETAKLIKKKLKMPLLICGGAGNWEHFVEAYEKANVDAVCTNNIYHFTYKSISSAKNYCSDRKINIRLE